MSWLWGSSKSTKDATSELDPSLRDFLDKETARTQNEKPRQQSTSSQRPTNEPSHEYTSQLGLDKPGLQPTAEVGPSVFPERSTVPQQSQFQDGRYAHLWKNYRSPEELAEHALSDQEKMTAVLENLKHRKAAISRAAVANCVVEQLEQQECLMGGSYRDLATMCQKQGRAFNRCYEMQLRFLRALGYSMGPASREEEDRIQAHADKLYHQMLDRERLAAEAKAKDMQLPPAQPLIDGEQTVKALGQDSAFARMRREAMRSETHNVLTEEQQKALAHKVKDLDEESRAVELQLIAAERRLFQGVRGDLNSMHTSELEARRRRRAEGNETIGDKLKRYSGWQQ